MTDQLVTYANLIWAGGTHRFSIQHVPERMSVWGPPKLHDGIRAVLARQLAGIWSADDIIQPILVGLVGGGQFLPGKAAGRPWPDAEDLVDRFVRSRPLAESLPLSQCVLLAAIVGVPKRLADLPQRPEAFAEATSDG